MLGGLLIIGFIFWLIYSHFNLINRVTRLEKKLLGVEVPQTSVALSDTQPTTIPQPETPSPLTYRPASSQVEVAIESEFSKWLKKDPLVKVGAFLFLIGIGWFVSYAFANNWIGPVGRITLGLLAGVVFLILGLWRIRLYESEGALFTVLGSSTIMLTMFAARSIYDMFTPETALGVMFLSIVFVTFVSLTYSRSSLALGSLLLAGFAPYLVDSAPSFALSMSYLLVVVLGTLWVVYYTGWRTLTFTALIITYFHTFPYISGYENEIGLLWAFMFTAIFFVANLVSLWRQAGMQLTRVHAYTALGTVLYLVIWVLNVAPPEVQSLILVAWALVFGFGSYFAYVTTGSQTPFYVYGASGLILIGVATAAEFSGPALTIAYILEATVIYLLAQTIDMDREVKKHIGWVFILPCFLALQSLDPARWYDGIWQSDFVTLVVLILALFVSGFLALRRDEVGDDYLARALVIVASLYTMALIWNVNVASLASYDLAVMFSLIIYTLCGIVLYVRGVHEDKQLLRVGGGALLAFVVGRLLLVDVWSMDLLGRVITFVVIGLLLISTAFINKRSK